MHKVTFTNNSHGRLTGYIVGIPCVPEGGGTKPQADETWLVEITKVNARRTLVFVRAVRPWRDTSEDRQAIVHANVDFHNGVVKFLDRWSFPIKHTLHARLWEDYKLLSDNMNAVIIRDGKAILWNRKGKRPYILPLPRFATKYKNQLLLGKSEDIGHFLANLETFRSSAIEHAQKRKKQGD